MEDSLGFRIFDDVEDALTPFKHWDVDSHGNITYLGNTRTQITVEMLTRGNLLSHVMNKMLDREGAEKEFYFAFIQALRNAGYTTLEIDLTNIYNNIKAR